ncbi:MAG: shikimate dehydrogenase [Hyphomicrobium sp.]|nr:shikimate dehydrogenase [Hyphomicrobium sp.]
MTGTEMKHGKQACVIGWPIEHSRSPLIHGTWIARYGIDAAYSKVAVKPEELRDFLSTLGDRGFVGCNVTVPHKEAALALAAERHPTALAVGAANTLWIENGHLHAMNTDTYGFMANLDATAPQWRKIDRPPVVLGAGGAARAIVFGFLEAGVGRVVVCNRAPDRAETLAQHFGPKVEPAPWSERSRIGCQASVIVNTTTLGMKGAGDPDLDFQIFDSTVIVADIVYVPLETAMLKAARAAGLATVGGLGMLLHQAVPGFEKWFGIRPEVTPDLVRLLEADIEGRA